MHSLANRIGINKNDKASTDNLASIKNNLSCRPLASWLFSFPSFGIVLHDMQAFGFVALVLMCFATIVRVRIRITTLTIPLLFLLAN